MRNLLIEEVGSGMQDTRLTGEPLDRTHQGSNRKSGAVSVGLGTPYQARQGHPTARPLLMRLAMSLRPECEELDILLGTQSRSGILR